MYELWSETSIKPPPPSDVLVVTDERNDGDRGYLRTRHEIIPMLLGRVH
jgi:hypothetical protein